MRSIHYSDGGIWLAAAGACVCTPVLSLFWTPSSSECVLWVKRAPDLVKSFISLSSDISVCRCLLGWNWSEISSCLQLRLWQVNVFCHLIEQKPRHCNYLCVFVAAKVSCWVSYSNNVIYYSLLVTPFKSNIVTYYFLATVISYTTCYIVSSRHTEAVPMYLPHKAYFCLIIWYNTHCIAVRSDYKHSIVNPLPIRLYFIMYLITSHKFVRNFL